MTPSAALLSSCRPNCAWRIRFPPSTSNGVMTMPSTSAPHSLAIRATTGLAPVPVPPPSPAMMKTMFASATSARIGSSSSSAAARPRAGSPPAPSPRILREPRLSFVPTLNWRSAFASVCSTANATPGNSCAARWLTALLPAPPTPRTLMSQPGLRGTSTGASVSMIVVMCRECRHSCRPLILECGDSSPLWRGDLSPSNLMTCGPLAAHRALNAPSPGDKSPGQKRRQVGALHRNRLLSLSCGSPAQQSSERFPNRPPEKAAPGPPFLLERAVFRQPDCRRELRLIQRRLQPADRVGFPELRRQLEHVLRQLLDSGHARTSTAQHHACPQMVQQAGLRELRLDQLEGLLQSQSHDAPQVLEIHGLERQPVLIVVRKRQALVCVTDPRGAVFDLELFRTAQRHLQAVGQVVRDVVAADRQHAGVLDDAAAVNDELRGAAAQVDGQRTQFLLLGRQQRQRRGQAVEDDGLHLQLQPFDDADRILEPVEVLVNHVHVDLDSRAEQANRVEDAVPVLDPIGL